jgi:hypothetical protein
MTLFEFILLLVVVGIVRTTAVVVVADEEDDDAFSCCLLLVLGLIGGCNDLTVDGRQCTRSIHVNRYRMPIRPLQVLGNDEETLLQGRSDNDVVVGFFILVVAPILLFLCEGKIRWWLYCGQNHIM